MSDSAEKWRTTIEASARESLDRMAMLDFTLDPVANVPEDSKDSLRVSMKLEGTDAVRLELRLTKNLAATWSAALVGLDQEELDPSDLDDGACELLNMIAGTAKTQLGEVGIEFDLGIPEALPMTSSSSESPKETESVHIRARAGSDPLEIIAEFN